MDSDQRAEALGILDNLESATSSLAYTDVFGVPVDPASVRGTSMDIAGQLHRLRELVSDDNFTQQPEGTTMPELARGSILWWARLEELERTLGVVIDEQILESPNDLYYARMTREAVQNLLDTRPEPARRGAQHEA